MIGSEILLLEKIAEKHRKLYIDKSPSAGSNASNKRDSLATESKTFNSLIASEHEWFENELAQNAWVFELKNAINTINDNSKKLTDHIEIIDRKSREISDRSGSLRLSVERQLTEQQVMETMVSEISANLEFYKKFPLAQKLVEERRIDEALAEVLASLKFFGNNRNFQEAEIFVQRFGHLKAKILSVLSTQEVSDVALKILKSEISDPEIAEFLKDYELKYLGERAELAISELQKISDSLKIETASVRSYVRKFLGHVAELCDKERELCERKFGEISDEIFRAIADQTVIELGEIAGNFVDDLEKLRDVIEQISMNSKKFPDPVRLGLGALRKSLQERVAVSSVLNVRRGGGVRRTLEILSLLVGILDERTFQSVANEAVNVVLEEISEKADDELAVIGNLLLLREHVAMLECDLILKESEIVFPTMQDLFRAGIWNILTPRISDTEIDVKAKIEDTLRDASKNFVNRSVQSLLRPVVETGTIDEAVLANFWRAQLPRILASIRVALSTGKVDSLASAAALGGPLSQALVAACAVIDAAAAERMKNVFDECYAEIEAMSKAQVEQIVA